MDHRVFNVRTDVNACAIAHGDVRTPYASALKVGCGRKIPCRTEESNLRQRRACPTLYQLSYVPPRILLRFQRSINNHHSATSALNNSARITAHGGILETNCSQCRLVLVKKTPLRLSLERQGKRHEIHHSDQELMVVTL